MKFKILISVFLGIIVSGLYGCRSAPIQNVDNVPIRTNKANYTLDDVEKAIIRAGTITGWQIEKDRPGTILAVFTNPNFAAGVTITYNTSTYNIRYRNSRNLESKPGYIHENYNAWVKDLDTAIQRELLAQ